MTMTKENLRRQRSNAVEYMYERGVMNFPKNLNTSKKFQIVSFKNDTLVFYVINGNKKTRHFIFTHLSCEELENTNEAYAMKYYMMKFCKDMYDYSILQGA